MQLREEGKIDIDSPAHTIIDPWLAKQGRVHLGMERENEYMRLCNSLAGE